MSTVPPELKPISAYVARAHELAKAEPVIAYWCACALRRVGLTPQARTTPLRWP